MLHTQNNSLPVIMYVWLLLSCYLFVHTSNSCLFHIKNIQQYSPQLLQKDNEACEKLIKTKESKKHETIQKIRRTRYLPERVEKKTTTYRHGGSRESERYLPYGPVPARQSEARQVRSWLLAFCMPPPSVLTPNTAADLTSNSSRHNGRISTCDPLTRADPQWGQTPVL